MKVWSAGSCIGVVAQVPECPRVNARYVGVGCANSGVKAEKASRCARIVTVTECYNYRMQLPHGFTVTAADCTRQFLSLSEGELIFFDAESQF